MDDNFSKEQEQPKLSRETVEKSSVKESSQPATSSSDSEQKSTPQKPQSIVLVTKAKQAKEKSNAIKGELFEAFDRYISTTGKGVARYEKLSEPEREHTPQLKDLGGYEKWVIEAEEYAIDKRLRRTNIKEEEGFKRMENIDLQDILKDVVTRHGSKKCRHVILLGAAGMGKTTLARRLARDIRASKYPELKGKVVIMSDFRTLAAEEKLTPAAALIGNFFTDESKISETFKWMMEHQASLVYIIDSLDTLPFDLNDESRNIGYDEVATPREILYNLLSRNLFPNSTIITTSREYKVRNLNPNTRPNRCVVIDGLSDESVRDLTKGFIGDDKGEEFIQHVDSHCQIIRPLLTIPVFLIYAIISFVWDGFKPKSMSGIIIKFFTAIIRSPHALVPDAHTVLKNLMPMSLQGIKDGKILFSPLDLTKNGLKPEEVTDLSVLIPHSHMSSNLMQKEHFYLYFNHLTEQECLAALHVLSLNIEEFKNFIDTYVNKPNFAVVRRFLCGVLFNDEVLQAARDLCEISDEVEKKRLLSDYLKKALESRNFADTVELYIALQESGDCASELIKSSVHQINLFSDDIFLTLSKSDIQAVGFIFAHAQHLDQVNFIQLGIDETKMTLLSAAILQSRVKVGKMKWREQNYSQETIFQIAHIAEHCKVKDLAIRPFIGGYSFERVTASLIHFGEGLGAAKVDKLCFERFSLTNLKLLARIVQQCGVKVLRLIHCYLGANDMKQIFDSMRNTGTKLTELDLQSNQSIGEEGMQQVGKIIKLCEVKKLGISFCSLTTEHLRKLIEGIENGNLFELDIRGCSRHYLVPREAAFHLGVLVRDHGLKKIEVDSEYFLDHNFMKTFKEGCGTRKLDGLTLNAFKYKQLTQLIQVLPIINEELDLLCWQMKNKERSKLHNELQKLQPLNSEIRIHIGSKTIELQESADNGASHYQEQRSCGKKDPVPSFTIEKSSDAVLSSKQTGVASSEGSDEIEKEDVVPTYQLEKSSNVSTSSTTKEFPSFEGTRKSYASKASTETHIQGEEYSGSTVASLKYSELATSEGSSSVKQSLAVSSDCDEIIQMMKELLCRPISTVKSIGVNGGCINLFGTQLDFKSGAFNKDTQVSLSIVSLFDVPDEYLAISCALSCSTSGVPFNHFATITLPIHVKVENEEVIILKKEHQSSWREFCTVQSYGSTSVIFRVPHFCTFLAVLKKYVSVLWPWPRSIRAQNMIYYNERNLRICGLVCIQDELVIKSCRECVEHRGFQRALTLPDNFLIKPQETMNCTFEIEQPRNMQIHPRNHYSVTGAKLQNAKFHSADFTITPVPIETMLLTCTIREPNEDPKYHTVPLECPTHAAHELPLPVHGGTAFANVEAVAVHGQISPPAAQIQASTGNSSTHEPTSDVANIRVEESTEQAYLQHLTRDDVYHIESSKKKGKVLIINNEFRGRGEAERVGSEVDVRNLTEVWQQLGFEVISESNLTAQQMLSSVTGFANTTRNVSVVAVIAMSHGNKGHDGKEYVYGEDNQPVLVDAVISALNTNNCGHLDGIPKIFMFQACRGSMADVRQDARNTETDTQPQAHGPSRSPERADMLIVYATQPGFISLRDTENGSWLMNAVTSIFMEKACNSHVIDMLTEVNRAVSEREARYPFPDNRALTQISCQEQYLRKKIFLFPGFPRQIPALAPQNEG